MARNKEQPGIVQRIKRGLIWTGVIGAGVLSLYVYGGMHDTDQNPEVAAAADCKPTKEPVGAECTAKSAGQYLLVMHGLIYESVNAKPGDDFDLAVDRKGAIDIECDRRQPKTYTIEFAPGPADESVVMYTYDFC